uniref:ethanolamine kinase n=1 Tax=Gopherus evgoodei TaxID=1825980 RepID=A0A8C4VED5_9SAUR
MILPSFYIVCFIRSQSTFPRRSISLAPFHRWENWAVPYPSRLGIELGLEGKWSVLSTRPHSCSNPLPLSLSLQLFTDGITNKLMACYMDEGMADAVLVRVYGRKTELFVDRENELKNFQVLRAHGCAPNLYCTFQNGLCYEFMQGTALGPEHVQQPQIFRCVCPGKWPKCMQFTPMGASPSPACGTSYTSTLPS